MRDYNRGIPGGDHARSASAGRVGRGRARARPRRGAARRGAAPATSRTVTRAARRGRARRREGAAPRPDAALFAAGRAGSRSSGCWSSAEPTSTRARRFFGQTPLAASLGGGPAEPATARSRSSCCRRAPPTRPRRSTWPCGTATWSWRGGARDRTRGAARAHGRARARPTRPRRRPPSCRRCSPPRRPAARSALPFAIAPDDLKKYAGRYRGGQRRPVTTVAVRGDGLVITAEGAPELVRRAVADGRFESAAGDVEVASGGRAGTIEGLAREPRRRGRALRPRRPPIRRRSRRRRRPRWTAGCPARAPRGRGRSSAGRRRRGIGDGQGAPATWDVAKGANVRFKTPIPASRSRSPIVWGDRIFVTTRGQREGRHDDPHRPLRRRHVGRRPVRALVPPVRARRGDGRDRSGSARSTKARPPCGAT